MPVASPRLADLYARTPIGLASSGTVLQNFGALTPGLFGAVTLGDNVAIAPATKHLPPGLGALCRSNSEPRSRWAYDKACNLNAECPRVFQVLGLAESKLIQRTQVHIEFI